MNSYTVITRRWRSAFAGIFSLLCACPLFGVDSAVATPVGLKGFVYLEPLEIRKEFLVRLGALELGEDLPGMLDETLQEKVLEQVSAKVDIAFQVRADDGALDFELDQLRFVTLDPERGPVADQRALISSEDALVAGVFAALRSEFPGTIEVGWSLFTDAQPTVEIPVEASARPDLKGPSFSETLSFSVGEEVARCELPDIDIPFGLLEVELTPERTGPWPWAVAGAFLVAGIALGVFGLVFSTRERGTVFLSAGLSIAFAIGVALQTKKNAGESLPDGAQANALVETLLKNVYHAFALKQESDIYDTLAISVDGELLDDLYIEIRQSLERGSDAPRVKVLEVAMIDCATRPAGEGRGIRADVSWACRGTVSHWGHSHQRHNSYQASMVIEPVEERWKITEIDVANVTKA